MVICIAILIGAILKRDVLTYKNQQKATTAQEHSAKIIDNVFLARMKQFN